MTSNSEEIKKIFEYLNIEFNEKDILKFSNIKLSGRMGDPTGIHKYSSIKDGSEGKWEKTLSSPLRKWWCRNYLQWIGKERLNTMGYDLNNLLNDLDSIPTSYNDFIIDVIRFIYGEMNILFSIDNIKINYKKIRLNKIVYPFF